jgi:hypothetical protein
MLLIQTIRYPLYAFLSGKFENVYKKVFDVILQHVTKYPTSISIDFETAVRNDFRQQLPTTINACFFHFKQNPWRNIRVSFA